MSIVCDIMVAARVAAWKYLERRRKRAERRRKRAQVALERERL